MSQFCDENFYPDKDLKIVFELTRQDVDMRIFSFGVGEEINEAFLTRLSRNNHGYAKFIASDDSIALVVNDHFTRISKPIMTDISLDMGGFDPVDLYPKFVGDLFWGSQVMQMGLYENGGTFLREYEEGICDS